MSKAGESNGAGCKSGTTTDQLHPNNRSDILEDSHDNEAEMISSSPEERAARSRPSNPPTRPSSAPLARFLPRLDMPVGTDAVSALCLGSNNGDRYPSESRKRRVGYSMGTKAAG